MSEIKPVAWLVGNDSVGPYALRHTDPKGWKYSAGLMKISDHEAEIARLRAEVEAYRKDAERWRFFQTAGYNVTLRMHYTRPDEREKAIDAAMGASA
ncbi:hypothetical protein ACN9MD_09550 [Stenotrophomonas maltophilia]|uniref:hypothetical protein n=1 Tax=Stenotrophomonas maltophilia TaxID=40324 RepID=UPI003CFAF168